jgi:hypothetical protein
MWLFFLMCERNILREEVLIFSWPDRFITSIIKGGRWAVAELEIWFRRVFFFFSSMNEKN